MNLLDIFTYFVNQTPTAILLIFLCTIPYIGLCAVFLDSKPYSHRYDEEETVKFIINSIKWFSLPCVLIFILTMLPTHGRILDLKISKIKNEAVNSDNVQKIENVLKKLECKYLGCEEEE